MLSGLSAADPPEPSGAFWRMSKAGEEGSISCASVPPRVEGAACGGAGRLPGGPEAWRFLGSVTSMVYFPSRPKLQNDGRGGSSAASGAGVRVSEAGEGAGGSGSAGRASSSIPSPGVESSPSSGARIRRGTGSGSRSGDQSEMGAGSISARGSSPGPAGGSGASTGEVIGSFPDGAGDQGDPPSRKSASASVIPISSSRSLSTVPFGGAAAVIVVS